MFKENDDPLNLSKANEFLRDIFELENFSILKSWYNKNKSTIIDESKIMLFEIISSAANIIDKLKKELKEKEKYYFLYSKLKEEYDHNVKIEVEKMEKNCEDKAVKISNELMSMIEQIEKNAIKEKNDLLSKVEILKKQNEDYKNILNENIHKEKENNENLINEFKKQNENSIKIIDGFQKQINKNKKIIEELKKLNESNNSKIDNLLK